MKKWFIYIILLLFCSNVIAQTRPSGNPTQFSTGWFKGGYYQGDSGVIWRPRDTASFLPRFTGTVVLDPLTRRPYLYDSTELRWYKLLVQGDVGSAVWGGITGTLSNQTDLQNALNLKLNISDTAAMLNPYPRGSGIANQVTYWSATRSIKGDAGFTYNETTKAASVDSIRSKTVQADEHLLPPIGDTLAAAVRRGEIRYDSTTGSIVYSNGIWNYIQSIVGNRPGIQLAAGVIRGIYNSGTGLTEWSFIINPTHDSLYFTGISVVGSTLEVYYPSSQHVISFVALPDEGLAPWITIGSSVGTTKAVLSLYQYRGNQGGFYRGNSTTYTASSRMTGWTLSFTQATGTLLFTPSVPNSGFTESEAVQFNYVGTNQYRTERLFSGLGGNTWGFQIVDAFGNPVTDVPTTADAIQISTDVTFNPVLSPGGGGLVQQALFSGTTNIWLFGVFKRL